jgi:hypothetical protein
MEAGRLAARTQRSLTVSAALAFVACLASAGPAVQASAAGEVTLVV